jgi:pimeloyl-ACP methyl ester carboxylesterase
MWVDGDGVALNVEVQGPDGGPLVVFLHGVSGSVATYAWLPEAITAGRRIVRVDLRGHGHSERAPGTYAVDAYVADVVAVVRALGGGPDAPAVLVGHSLGGVVAWTVAQREPGLVAAAFLEDPPLYIGEPEEHERNAAIPMFSMLRELAADWQYQGMEEEAVAELLSRGPVGAALAPDALLSRARALLLMDPGVLDAAVDRSALAATDVVAPVTRPTLLLAADEQVGAAFPVAHGERLAASHPAVEVVRLEGVGHAIHDDRERRGAYVDALTGFLARHA